MHMPKYVWDSSKDEKGGFKMKVVDYTEYTEKFKKISEVTDKECYIGGHYCASCMHCFPGMAYISLKNYDGSNVCRMAKRK